MASVVLLLCALSLLETAFADKLECVNGDWNEKLQVCICKTGYSGRKCDIKARCCNVYGDPHYLTFDGAKFSFQGSCKYNLVSWCSCCCEAENNAVPAGKPDFRVYVKNWKRGDDKTKVSWVRHVEARILGHNYMLDLGRKAMVNEANVSLPYNKNGVHITHMGSSVRIDTSLGASIQYDGKSRLVLCVPITWENLCGLCGNNNGDKSDDLKRKDGVDVSGRPGRMGPLIGDSWQVDDPKDPECRTEDREDVPKPSEKWETLVKSRQYCGLITRKDSVYKDCMKHFGSDKIHAFYTNCKFDVYEMAQDPKLAKDVSCESLAAMASECEELGFPVSRWRFASKCPLTCPNNQISSYNTSMCQATCAEPNAPMTCQRPYGEGCTCPTGLILSGDKCIKPTECACTEADGTYHQPNEIWFSEDCKTKYQCVSEKAGTPPVIKTLKGCGHGEMCKAVDEIMQCVKIPVSGGWSAWGKWSECVRFGEDDFDVRVRVRSCDNPAPMNGGNCEGSVFETEACLPDEEVVENENVE